MINKTEELGELVKKGLFEARVFKLRAKRDGGLGKARVYWRRIPGRGHSRQRLQGCRFGRKAESPGKESLGDLLRKGRYSGKWESFERNVGSLGNIVLFKKPVVAPGQDH